MCGWFASMWSNLEFEMKSREKTTVSSSWFKKKKKKTFNNLESSKLETLGGWDYATDLAGVIITRQVGAAPSFPILGVTHFVHMAIQLTQHHWMIWPPFSLWLQRCFCYKSESMYICGSISVPFCTFLVILSIFVPRLPCINYHSFIIDPSNLCFLL